MDTYNIIAIGGTGMRCAESFVYLCAMGMFDDTHVNLLALDTDYDNGNFKRLQTLVGNYRSIISKRNGPACNTLFSAEIEDYYFSPDYKESTTFNSISSYAIAQGKEHGSDSVKWKESDLADLFLTEDMRNMSLREGYRAQTQMGSMLMYHAVIQEAYNYKKSGSAFQEKRGLPEFIENLMNNQKSKVFLFGSVFGGTGASSIPILPHALQKAAQIISQNGQADILSDNLFGTVMLTNYFTFGTPEGSDKVYATSDKFAFNSQAALFFYANDKTVRSTYKRLYLLGREQMRDISNEGTRSVKGGEAQRNPADYMELLAASAAYDFVHACRKHIDTPVFGKESETFYRTIESDKEEFLSFNTFFGADGEKFAEKCGIFTASAFLYGPGDFGTNRSNDKTFNSLKGDIRLSKLQEFFQSYYDLNQKDTNDPGGGWIKQMYRSAKDYRGFLFNNEVFKEESRPSNWIKFDYTKYLFTAESSHNASGGYDAFRKIFGEDNNIQSLQNTMEALLARTYATFRTLYKFS